MSGEDQAAQPEFHIERKITVAEIVGASIALAFLTGYLVHSIFARNYGILVAELVRPDYVVIGLTFCLLTASIVFLPLGTIYLTYQVRRKSGLPHFWIGLIGNVANTILFIGWLIFVVVFVTRHEWELKLSYPVLGIHSCSVAIVVALLLSIVGMAGVPILERVLNAHASNKAIVFRVVVEPLRFGLLVTATALCCLTTRSFSWSSTLVTRGSSYLAVLVVTAAGVGTAYYWIRRVRAIRGTAPIYVLVGIGVMILYYVAVSSYVWGVFNFIPGNRGGRLPLTETTLEIETGDRSTSVGPVCIIEETDDTIYYVKQDSMREWLSDFVPVESVKKDKVLFRHMQRMLMGFPRVVQAK